MEINLKHETIIYWSEEDQVFIAEVPELPGCMAHGDSSESALANAKEAAKLWIETASTLLTSLRLKTTGTLSPTLECLKEKFFN